MDIIDNAADYPKSQSQLEKQLGLTAASLNSAITKGWLNKKSVEVYRDPLSGFDDGEHKTAVTLNGEQQGALNQITQAIEQRQAETFCWKGLLVAGRLKCIYTLLARLLNRGEMH